MLPDTSEIPKVSVTLLFQETHDGRLQIAVSQCPPREYFDSEVQEAIDRESKSVKAAMSVIDLVGRFAAQSIYATPKR